MAVVMVIVSVFVGWLASRIESAHRKIFTESENRYEDYKEIAKELRDRMTRNEVTNMVDSRVKPIDANLIEIKQDVKALIKSRSIQ